MVKYYVEKSRCGDFDIDPLKQCDSLVTFNSFNENEADIIRNSYEEDPNPLHQGNKEHSEQILKNSSGDDSKACHRGSRHDNHKTPSLSDGSRCK
jgi:hypothetical protein